MTFFLIVYALLVLVIIPFGVPILLREPKYIREARKAYPPYVRSVKEAMQIQATQQRSNERIIREQYDVIPELTVRVRNKRPYAHIRLGPHYDQDKDVKWLNDMQAQLEIPTLPFVRL